VNAAMTVARLSVLAIGTVLVAGCSSFRSGGDLFATGRDARVFNPSTGRYEWPEEPSRRAAARRSSRLSASDPSATPAGDGRVYNLEKGRYEWSDSGLPKTSAHSE
jgi:hypothetical protein